MKDAKLETTAAYLHGRYEREIEAYEQALGCTTGELARRVGRLLAGDTEKQELLLESVSGMLAKTSKKNKRVREVEVSGVPRDNRASGKHGKTLTSRQVKGKSSAKAYWDSMSEEQRKAEMARRIAKRLAKKNKAA